MKKYATVRWNSDMFELTLDMSDSEVLDVVVEYHGRDFTYMADNLYVKIVMASGAVKYVTLTDELVDMALVDIMEDL